MIDDNKTARGRASGTNVALRYMMRRRMRNPLMSFPTKSSIHNQKNWRISTKSVMKKVAINGPIKDLTTSISSFLIKAEYY
jgi:hypothetical protein